MSDFLDNLENSLEKGEFNSEAAKKIIEIGDLSEIKASGTTIEELEKNVEGRYKKSEIKKADEKTVDDLNVEYKKIMEEKAHEEKILSLHATLINQDKLIDDELFNIIDLIKRIKENYKPTDKNCKDLFIKVKIMEDKYKLDK
jgi:hypothetical protein